MLSNHKNIFDVETPKQGHKLRFIKKLKQANVTVATKQKGHNWYYAVAAAMVLSVGVWIVKSNLNANRVNTVVTDEMHSDPNFTEEVANAQFYFEGIVKREIAKIELERNTDTQEIINDAFKQLKVLEKEQLRLQEQLNMNYDKRIVKALINNFQYRIQLLENVMIQIELVKEIKTQNYETI